MAETKKYLTMKERICFTVGAFGRSGIYTLMSMFTKNQLLMDQVPIPFPSGKQRRQDRRNGKEEMRCLSQR